MTIAGSVWGGGSHGQIKGYLQQWRATDNGLEGTAAAHCDALSCFDELSQIGPQAAGAAAYMLANGAGKVRAGRGGDTRPVAEWRCLFLSSGEIGLGDKIAEDGHGRRMAAGQEVRVIDIPADAGAGLGLFERLHDQPNAEVFARHMKEAAGRCYGTAARAFLEKIVTCLDEVKAVVMTDRDSFVAEVCPAGADGQIQRVAGRFGLLVAAGRLATALGIVPWGPDGAFIAVRRCFEGWLAERGGLEPAEDREALAAVRRFIEQHGSSRFEVIRLDSSGHEVTSDRVRERAGFRREIDGVVHYYILPGAWTLDVCMGIDPKRAAQVLSAAGLLIADKGRLQDKCRLPVGPRSIWCYHLTGAVLAGGDDQGHD